VATVVAVRVTVGWLIHRELEAAGLAAGSQEGNGRARYWSPAIATPDADNAGDDQAGEGGGEGMA
jgi:hypothetical protein